MGSGNFTEVDFRGRKFHVRSKAKDIINWIVQGREGELKVSKAFEKYLRVGYSKDPTVEKGYCAKAHQGGKHAIFLDIGANAGFYGLYAAACGCRTYFFDIQEECHEWITSAIDKNNFHHAALIPFPVGNVSRVINVPTTSTGCWGTFSLSKSSHVQWYQKKDKAMDIRMVRIDEIFGPAMKDGSLGVVACVKIDVEGFEIGILASMRELLRHVQPDGKGTVRNVVVELAPTRWAGVPGGMSRKEAADIVVDVLWDAGFQKVTCWGNNDWDDSHFRFRHGLHEWIQDINFMGISQDFEFKRTKIGEIDDVDGI